MFLFVYLGVGFGFCLVLVLLFEESYSPFLIETLLRTSLLFIWD